jgi:type IV secretory pathway protease TraF
MKKIVQIILVILCALAPAALPAADIVTFPALPLHEAASFILGEYRLRDPKSKITKFVITDSPEAFTVPTKCQRRYFSTKGHAEQFLKGIMRVYDAEYELRDDTLVIKAKRRSSPL